MFQFEQKHLNKILPSLNQKDQTDIIALQHIFISEETAYSTSQETSKTTSSLTFSSHWAVTMTTEHSSRPIDKLAVKVHLNQSRFITQTSER